MIPRAYDGHRPLPLLLDLHGLSSNIDQQNLFSNLPEAAAERGYVLLTPQGMDVTTTIRGQPFTAPFWNIRPDQMDGAAGAQDDVAFLTRLIDDTIGALCIDRDRVYVTGNSNGAGMAAVLACALPEQIAAIAPVSGINLAPRCGDLRATSVVAFHGDADPLVPYDGGPAANTGVTNPPVLGALGEFARAAGCDDEHASERLHSDITLQRWPGCDPGLDVELYTVLGGGHTWPGMLNYVDPTKLSELAAGMQLPELAGVDLAAIAGNMTTSIEATSVMLDFFDHHQRAD